MPEGNGTSVTVVVLGDLGRSPRMQYHAAALASKGVRVDLVGLDGEESFALVRRPEIREHRIPARPQEMPRPLFLLYSLAKASLQASRLLWTLLVSTPRPKALLVQNPPAVPTLLVALLASRLHRCRWVIDWHNFGDAMLATTLGPRHPLVRLAGWYEGAIGRRADAHLCVSAAMQARLRQRWRIEASVVCDRPPAQFRPTPADAAHALFLRLGAELGGDAPVRAERTLVTEVVPGSGGEIRLRPDRPALVVSPTSWTADEDVDLLLDAVVRLEEIVRGNGRPFPQVLIVLTGKGPRRAEYEGRMRGLRTRWVRLRTLWLAPDDYPVFLGSADIGLSLHRSASGVDLPMKVADLLGSGVPVCALDYAPCVAEQVRHGENGVVFADAASLAAQLFDLLGGFPDRAPRLRQLRANVEAVRVPRWDEEWDKNAYPVLFPEKG